MCATGLTDTQIIGNCGQDDVASVLTSAFTRCELSSEAPDFGTDLFCKIPAEGSRFFPVEWRIQIKATTRPTMTAELTSRRALQVLGNPGSNWYLFLVRYARPASDIATMAPEERAVHRQIYAIDLRRALTATNPSPRRGTFHQRVGLPSLGRKNIAKAGRSSRTL